MIKKKPQELYFMIKCVGEDMVLGTFLGSGIENAPTPKIYLFSYLVCKPRTQKGWGEPCNFHCKTRPPFVVLANCETSPSVAGYET